MSLVMSWKKLDAKVKQRAAYLTWCIWTERNLKVFEDKFTPNDVLLARVFRLVDEYEKNNKSIYRTDPLRSRLSYNFWVAPPVGVIKLNVDASLADEGWIVMGAVARNNEGHVLFAASRRVRAWWPPEIAEGKALLMAVRLAKNYVYEDVILESDCQVLINRISSAAVYFSDLDSVLEDILLMSRVFNSISWPHEKEMTIMLVILLE